MENSIVFDDKEDLARKIDHVLEMHPHEVANLRERVIAYYEKHLSPRNFIDAIESREDSKVTVLMITDKNTRKNASRLNRRSILITGKATFADSWWYRVFRSFGITE
jgi:hypothetical protein